MRLNVGEEKIVVFSHKMKKMEWGLFEFPDAGIMPDGRIIVRWHTAEDSMDGFNAVPGYAVSSDGGETWEVIDLEKEPFGEMIQVFTGTRLPNGEYIHNFIPKHTKIDVETYKELSKSILVDKVNGKTPTDYDKIPAKAAEGLVSKAYQYMITKDNCTKVDIMESKIDFPFLVYLIPGQVSNPFSDTRIRVAPDGSIWQVAYQSEYDPETGIYRRYHQALFFKSTDNGKSFELMSKITYNLPIDTEWDKIQEGFSEEDITFLPDGSMITILRTGFFIPSYIARSTDGGRTWSEPQKFDYCGTQPRLHTFKNGVTVASYGRPGLYIRATDDPSGMKWQEPIEIIPRLYGDTFEELEKNVNDTSCFNPDLLPISDTEFLLFYSDSRHRDEDGSIRKSIRVRKITVEL